LVKFGKKNYFLILFQALKAPTVKTHFIKYALKAEKSDLIVRVA